MLIESSHNADTGVWLPLGPSQVMLLYVLYGMTGTCFLTGMLILGRGFVSLTRVLAERP